MLTNYCLRDAMSDVDNHLWQEVAVLIWDTRNLMSKVPRQRQPYFECHTMSRAIALVLPKLNCVDGFVKGFKPTVEHENGDKTYIFDSCRHSWLLTPDGAIIDPYPVGFVVAQPILLPKGSIYSPFGHDMYEADSSITTHVAGRTLYRRSIVLAKFMRQAQAQAA